MSEQEYFTAINRIRNKISQGIMHHVQDELDDLFHYKPVRLLWFISQAEYYLAIGSKEKVWPLLGDKFLRLDYYPGMNEIREFHKKWAVSHNDNLQKMQMEHIYRKVIENIDINYEEIEDFSKKVESCGYTYNSFVDLGSVLFVRNRILEYFIIRQYLITKKYLERNENEWYYSLPNYGYLIEQLLDSRRLFLLVSNNTNKQIIQILSYVISELGHTVYVVEEDGYIFDEISESKVMLQKSLDFKGTTKYAVTIPVFTYYNPEGLIENNVDHIIEYIYKNYAEDEFAILISQADVMLNLMEYSYLRKDIEALEAIDINFLNDLKFSRVGNYLGYLKSIYNENIAESLEEPDECNFSIVIPARNSAGTLQYTIQTCLNQDFAGTFEIIVNDNSQDGHNEIKSLCEDINDQRVKYYRTPRDLQLTKSFEYAFLKARGTFILSIGSDDGLFSWALSTLDEVLNKYPKESIIQWKRGFYAWPGFNRDQENELLVLNKPVNYQASLKSNLDYFAEILNNTQNIYGLPLLYINSGFRRAYLKELLMKTGRLWDGCNQDVNIGIVNIAINKTILNIDYPIAIAGMSNDSMGYRSMKSDIDTVCSDNEIHKKLNSNVAIYCTNSYECLIPRGKDDVCSLYWNILRAIRLGIISEDWLVNIIDLKKIYIEYFSQHTCMDVNFDKYLHNARYLARKQGVDFLNWFDNDIYSKAVIPKYISESNNIQSQKSYQEGKTKEGNLIIDASKYQIKNIADAVVLSEKIYREAIHMEV